MSLRAHVYRGHSLRYAVISALLLLALASGSLAETISVTVETPQDAIRIGGPPNRLSVSVNAHGFAQTTTVGEPSLPLRIVNVLLPRNTSVASFEIIPSAMSTLRRAVRIGPAPPMMSEDGVPAEHEGLARRSHDRLLFPDTDGEYLSTGFWRGRAIASFVVYPFRMRGDNLETVESFELRVTTEPSVAMGDVVMRERLRAGTLAKERAALTRIVANPDADPGRFANIAPPAKQRGGFQPTAYPSLEGSPVDYLIITTGDLTDEYQVLADWKTAKGLPTVVRTVEWILGNTRSGSDTPETIRFFIRDAYAKWGIKYVLLGGDTDVVPTRYGLSRYWPPGGETAIPTDLYFACLDGSWNENHDGNWGEPELDNTDFYAEVYVGRLPITEPAGVTAIIDRIKGYESAQNQSYLDKYVFLAEVLFPEDWSEGETIFTDGAQFSEPIYHTVLDTTALRVTRMYQTDNLYPGSVAETKSAVLDSMNAGFNYVFHIGHGFRHNMSVADASIRSPDADSLSNGEEPFNLYMLNCTAAAYDYFCLGEHFLQNPAGGAVSVIGASESAFPFGSSYYMNEYNDVLFDGVVHIGETFGLSRLPRTPLAVGVDGPDAWTHFIYVLLGDPAMQLFTGTVDTLDVVHPAAVAMGQGQIPVSVSAGGQPVDSAVVCLVKDDDDYETVTTGGIGLALVDFTSESPGSISVVVTGHNLARYQGYIEVVPAGTAYVSAANVTIDDDSSGGTLGNSNGVADAGETIDFLIELVNNGGSPAIDVSLSAASMDPMATVVGAVAQYGDIGVSMIKPAQDGIRVTLDPAIDDESAIEFELTVTDSSAAVWSDRFKQVVHAPALELTTLRVDDTAMGDGDGVVGAGEPFRLYYRVKNYGTGTANGLSAIVADVDGAFILVDSVDSYLDIGPLAEDENLLGFYMTEVDTTTGHGLRIEITDSYARALIDTIELRPPEAPGDLSFDASQGADRLSVRWLASPSTDVARFNVYRSLSDIGPFSRVNVDAVDHRVYLDSGLAALTRYYYFATAVDFSGNESAPSAVYSASTNPPLMAGFPIQLPLPTTSSPAVGDIDGDGDNEIVVGNQYVYAWHSDGFELVDGDLDPRSWGALNRAGDEFTAAIALAHIDDAAGLDIIAADLMTMSVYCMDYTGAVLPGWPRLGEDKFRAAPVAGDLDGDGRVEIIAVDASGVVFAWNRDGSEVIDGDSNPATQGVFFRSPATTFHYHGLAVCDIDLDFKDEIILGTRSGNAYALNGDGSSVPGWPFTLPGEMAGGVVTGFVDDDIFPDVVVRSATDEVYLLNGDATIKPGWPRSVPYTEAYFRATPALADLDGDGTLEIVLAQHTTAPLESKVFVLDQQGNDVSGWPVIFSDQFTESSPIVADADGDGQLDIIIGDEEGIIHGWDRDGNVLEGFPIVAQDAIRATPTIWDTDGDGDEELVIYSWDQRVYVYDLSAPHDPGAGGWPTAHSNTHRNGRGGWTVATSVTNPAEEPVTRAGLLQNYPNPFNPATEIVFFVPEGTPRSVSLIVYDITGARVRTLVDGQRPPGRFVARWDGRDDRGTPVASGVYFYHMTQQGYTATRKMIFLK